jgi:hypothetical protein
MWTRVCRHILAQLPRQRVRCNAAHACCHQIRCLNEDVEGSCRAVFRPWAQRTTPPVQPLRSDPDDPELLLHIP